MMSNDNMVQMLIIAAVGIGMIILIFGFVMFIIHSKEKRIERERKEAE